MNEHSDRDHSEEPTFGLPESVDLTGFEAAYANAPHAAAVAGPDPVQGATPAQVEAVVMAWHDTTCPEGADCPSRWLHSRSNGWLRAQEIADAVVAAGDAASPVTGERSGGGAGDTVAGEAGRVGLFAAAIYDQAVDHPMWIGADSQPLDYNPDREVRLGDFIDDAARAVMAVADAEHAEMRAEVERLRAGESEDDAPINAVPTPGQWLRRFNEATPDDRLAAAERAIANSETVHWHFMHNTRGQIVHWKRRAEAAEHALAEERAKVARVEALMVAARTAAQAPDEYDPAWRYRLPVVEVFYLEAALAGPEPEATGVVHMCPPGDEALTPCCGKSPFELPLLSSRMTVDPSLVTCKGRPRARA